MKNVTKYFQSQLSNGLTDLENLQAAQKHFGWSVDETMKRARMPAQCRAIAKRDAKLRAALTVVPPVTE